VLHHTLSYKRLLHESFLRLLLADTRENDALICTSLAARAALQRIIGDVAEAFNARHGTQLAYRGRYELIPLAVDLERFKPLPRDAARAAFELPEDAFVLLWVGRMSIVDKADLLPLVDAFAELVRDNPGRKLLLVCAGTQRPGERFGDVVRDYAARPELDGLVRVMNDDEHYGHRLPELYAAADAFVSPSDNLQESFGITPVEALACGVPQIVADWDGYRDTVVDGETGFLVPTLWARCDHELVDGALLTEESYDHLVLAQSVAVDMRAFAAAVQRLLDEPGLRERMSRASRARAEERYGWPTIIAAHERLWAELGAVPAPAPRPGRDYGVLRFSHVFEGHPTRMLDDDTALELTDRGRALIAGASLPSHYNRQFRYLDSALVTRIMAGVERFAQKGEALDVRRVVGVLTRSTPGELARARVLRHLMWLLKYDYVRASSPARRP
jgi:D-inositol-3-phosphate glycosyltransferase